MVLAHPGAVVISRVLMRGRQVRGKSRCELLAVKREEGAGAGAQVLPEAGRGQISP